MFSLPPCQENYRFYYYWCGYVGLTLTNTQVCTLHTQTHTHTYRCGPTVQELFKFLLCYASPALLSYKVSILPPQV